MTKKYDEEKYINTKVVTYPGGYQEVVTTDARVAIRQPNGEVLICDPDTKLPIKTD